MTETASRADIQAGIDAAIAASGGKQAILAQSLGCAQQTVSKLRSGEIPMTADWALRIEAAVNGAIPASTFVPALGARATASEKLAGVPA